VGEALREYAALSESSLLRTCLAFSMVQGEDAVAGGWGHERAERHPFLKAKGYEPTAYEVEQAEAAARRHEQSLAGTAELRADPARAEQAIAEAEDSPSGNDAGPLGPEDVEEADRGPLAQEAAVEDAG